MHVAQAHIATHHSGSGYDLDYGGSEDAGEGGEGDGELHLGVGGR